jgi:hypothetical protein
VTISAETVGESMPELAGRLIDRATAEGATLRALGGVAVALRCPSARAPGGLARSFSDVDFAIRRGQQKPTTAAMTEHGLEPAARFNAMQGDTRLLFEREDGLHVDVFVGRFELCHALPLNKRLLIDEMTLPLADLLLTKLQVAKLNHKDVTDTVAILLDYPLAEDDSAINVPYLAGVLAADWGWWRTVTENLAKLREQLAGLPISSSGKLVVDGRLEELERAIEAEPKSVRWRMRARIGDRRPWRHEPEDHLG